MTGPFSSHGHGQQPHPRRHTDSRPLTAFARRLCRVRRLLQHGNKVVVYNRSRDKVSQLVTEFPDSVAVAETPREVAERAPVTFSMLSTPEVARAVFYGDKGKEEEEGGLDRNVSEWAGFRHCVCPFTCTVEVLVVWPFRADHDVAICGRLGSRGGPEEAGSLYTVCRIQVLDNPFDPPRRPSSKLPLLTTGYVGVLSAQGCWRGWARVVAWWTARLYRRRTWRSLIGPSRTRADGSSRRLSRAVR
jgi:hypothetical protein